MSAKNNIVLNNIRDSLGFVQDWVYFIYLFI